MPAFKADLPREVAVGMVLGEARRAEDRHARPEEMKLAKAADELGEDAQRPKKLNLAPLRASEEPCLFRVGSCF